MAETNPLFDRKKKKTVFFTPPSISALRPRMILDWKEVIVGDSLDKEDINEFLDSDSNTGKNERLLKVNCDSSGEALCHKRNLEKHTANL